MDIDSGCLDGKSNFVLESFDALYWFYFRAGVIRCATFDEIKQIQTMVEKDAVSCFLSLVGGTHYSEQYCVQFACIISDGLLE